MLLVEDNCFNQKVAGKLLPKSNLHLSMANNGQEALDALSREPFKLVFMDVQMPVMDGLEATQKIREGVVPGCENIAIVAMTAHAMEGDREMCLDAGMNDYLPKPFKPEQLQAALVKWLPRAVGKSLGDVPAMIQSGLDAEGYDLIEVKNKFGEDPELLMELATIFLEDAPVNLSALAHALAKDDGPEAHFSAHSLKGTCGNFGMMDLHKHFTSVDDACKKGDMEAARRSFMPARRLMKKALKSLELLLLERRV